MKKFLALVLVLALASMAHAGPVLTIRVGGVDVGSDYTIQPSDNITIGVYSDGIGGTNGKYSGAMVINPYASDTGAGSWVASSEAMYSPPLVLSTGASVSISGPTLLFIATNTVIADSVGAGIGFDALFHCDGEGDVTIVIFDDVFGPVDTLTIHQIPEPMTVALLGLGGLFLRRRKK